MKHFKMQKIQIFPDSGYLRAGDRSQTNSEPEMTADKLTLSVELGWKENVSYDYATTRIDFLFYFIFMENLIRFV